MTNRKNIIKKEAVVWALVMALTLSPLSVAAEANYSAGGGSTIGTYADHAIAIGTDDADTNTVANAQYSVAVGVSAQATGWSSSAYGNNAQAEGQNSAAYGSYAQTTGDYSSAYGWYAKAEGQNSAAYGSHAHASADFSSAYGWYANAEGDQSSAYGSEANATGDYSSAYGCGARATGWGSSAYGNGAWAAAQYSSAYGVEAQAAAESSAAYGNKAQATGKFSTASGYQAQATRAYSSAYGSNAQATAEGSAAYGNGAEAKDKYSSAFGNNAIASGDSSAAYGSGAHAMGESSAAFGNNANATGKFSTASGYKAQATGWGSSAYGNGAQATALSSSAYGYSAIASADFSAAYGSGAKATVAYGVALGTGSTADRQTTVTGVYVPTGASSTAVNNTVKGNMGIASIGDTYVTRQLAGVAAGIEDSDAVNVAQLKALDGVVVANTQKITSNDARITANSGRITALDGVAVKYDQNTNRTSVTFGDGKNLVKLKNVADGDISAANSKEAVNGGQLYATNRYIDTVSGDLGRKIGDISVKTELAVKYDGDKKTSVTFGDGKTLVKLKNVADGDISAANSKEAVNGGQLYATNRYIDTVSGDLVRKINDISVNTELAVKYDDDTKKAVTFGDGKNLVKLKNIADADLSEKSTEAVTGKQLYATNQNISAVSGDLNQKINNISVETGFAVKYDNAAKTSVTFGNDSTPVTLKNVAAGTSETEAVNYGQLSELDAKVNTLGGTIAERMGGAYDQNTGKITVTYPSDPTPPANIAAAPSGPAANEAIPGGDPTLNETLQKMWDSIQANSVTAGDNISVEGGKVSVVKNPEFESVRVGAVDITREGIDMGGKKITGLADGGIYNGSRDAVNGGQLWNAYNRIEELDNDIRVAGAHAAALSAMHPVAYNPYEPTTISAGYGYYRSEQSFAVGVFHYIRENVLVNAGMAFNSGGDTMGRAGVSFALGKSGRKQPSMIKDVNEMQKQMAAMQEMLMQLKEENEKNKEENRKNREIIKELKEALKEK